MGNYHGDCIECGRELNRQSGKCDGRNCVKRKQHNKENARFADECRYLESLLAGRGDHNMSWSQVGSYFAVQAVAARQARFHQLAATLGDIAAEFSVDADGSTVAEWQTMLLAHARALS